jgi:hypothetical protein
MCHLLIQNQQQKKNNNKTKQNQRLIDATYLVKKANGLASFRRGH